MRGCGGALRVARWVVPVTVSGLVWWAVLPSVAGLPGLAVAVTVTSAAGLLWRRPIGVCWSWCSAVPPSESDAIALRDPLTLISRVGWGPPRVELRVGAAVRGLRAIAVGHRRVVVPRGMVVALGSGSVGVHEAAAGLCHAAAVARFGLSRKDDFLRLWCLPWAALAGMAQGVTAGFRRRAPLGWAVRMRPVVFAVAVTQTWEAQRVPMALLLTVIGAVTYLQPALTRWERERSERVGDLAVARAGLGLPYLRLLAISGVAVSPERRTRLGASPGEPARCAARG